MAVKKERKQIDITDNLLEESVEVVQLYCDYCHDNICIVIMLIIIIILIYNCIPTCNNTLFTPDLRFTYCSMFFC